MSKQRYKIVANAGYLTIIATDDPITDEEYDGMVAHVVRHVAQYLQWDELRATLHVDQLLAHGLRELRAAGGLAESPKHECGFQPPITWPH